MSEAEPKRGWRRIALVGCGCLTVAALAGAALVFLNWSTLSGMYQRAAAGMSELFAVRAAIQKRYDTPDVAVLVRHRSSVQGPVLVVRMVNPRFLDDVAAGQEREKALEIARFARDNLKGAASFRAFEVTFSRQATVGVTASFNQVFTFDATELEGGPAPRPSARRAAPVASA